MHVIYIHLIRTFIYVPFLNVSCNVLLKQVFNSRKLRANAMIGYFKVNLWIAYLTCTGA